MNKKKKGMKFRVYFLLMNQIGHVYIYLNVINVLDYFLCVFIWKLHKEQFNEELKHFFAYYELFRKL